MVQRKGGRVSAEDPDELVHVPLQAILLADSFATKFRPITLERPKVLLPLVNVPMIDYSLAWLESAGVEDVFVFCCAHSKQVITYLENSQWVKQPHFSVNTIESNNCVSAGDALRLIYERNVIHGDFILITGDTVSNMSISQALQEHKERKKKDSNAVMTMVVKRSKPSAVTHRSRLGADELFMAIDPNTKQLLYYEDKGNLVKGIITLDKTLVSESPSISLHNDMQDCYIDICSPEVLSLFTDNFDYQHLRRHFVKGLLVDDIMGYKIFTHEIDSSYAAKIDYYRGYDTISKDIIQRWTYPLVPDVLSFGNSATKLDRQGMYRPSGIAQSRTAAVGPFTVVGNGTIIGSNSKISNSVIGEGCKIGANVSIEGSYIWNNVSIEDGCKLTHAIVCDGVVMKPGSVLEPGVVLSFKVVIGPGFVVPAYSKVSLFQQPAAEDSDEELEYADGTGGVGDVISLMNSVGFSDGELTSKSTEISAAASEVGSGGAGYIWPVWEGGSEEEWRYSVAPLPADKLDKLADAGEDDFDSPQQDGSMLPPSGELTTNSMDSDDENVEESFDKEVEATFLRAVDENISVENVILEVNSLRLSYNMIASDCAGALFYSLAKLALDTPHKSVGDLHANVAKVIATWKKLLMYYLPSIDEEIEVILKFEEMCVDESTKKLSPLFSQILHLLYEEEVIEEEAIFSWAAEKAHAGEDDKIFLNQSASFIEWLKTAESESEEE